MRNNHTVETIIFPKFTPLGVLISVGEVQCNIPEHRQGSTYSTPNISPRELRESARGTHNVFREP